MSDNLTVFGVDYTNVAGIKAHATSDSSLVAYIRPQGTKSIAANGTGIDVTEYASVNVAVPAQDNSLIVALSWDDDYFGQNEGAWVPDCTWAEVSAAAQAGKEICVRSDEDMSPADGYWEGDPSFTLWYCVVVYSSSEAKFLGYALSQDGLALSWYDHISLPTGTINITQAGNTDVTQYATASVPNAQYDLGSYAEYLTQSNQRKWRYRPVYEGWNAGWKAAGTDYGTYISYNAVPSNTTVTPSTSAQTIGGANYMMEGAVTVAAMPTGTAGTPTATKGAVSNHAVSVTPSVTNTTGYITGGTKTGTAVSVSASELVSGTYTVDSSGTKDVTNYASASVAAGSATASATKGAVSNHSIAVTPSVTRTAGWVTAGTSSGTAVTVSASELVSGSQTVTQNGTVDVTNLASVVVDVQGGSPSLHVGTASTTPSSAQDGISFTLATNNPTSFAIIAHDTLSTGASPYKVASVVDGISEGIVGQVITNTSNAQVSYNENFYCNMQGDDNKTLVVYSSGTNFQPVQYDLVYTYGGGAIDTKQVQVGSGATSITFTGLEDEPACWYVIFQSNFSTSSGYQRVIAVANNGTDTYGLEMDSAAHYSDAHWSSSYSNGSLTITSQGTNAGGYFHQPGTYLLVYAYDASGNYQSKTVTPSQSTQEVTADSGYDALRKVTVNPIPSEYIVPTGNLAITSNTAAGQSLNVSQYATATVNVPTGGGSVSVDQMTWTNNSTSTVSHQFTGLKGTPKFAVLRCRAQLTRSSSSTYYYIADIVWDGTDAWGNYYQRSNGSFNNVANNAESGFNVTVSGSSITFSSDATRTSAPGSFYNGVYELTYVY